MIRGLFARLLAVMCGVAAASTALVMLLEVQSLSSDLERAAERRLDNAATAAGRLLDGHLAAMTERLRAVSGTPQFRATLEIDDGPTLEHYAGILADQQRSERVAFVDPEGRLVAASGNAQLDDAALAIADRGLIAWEDAAYAVVSVSIAGAGRLVVAESFEPKTLATWSELCGANVSFVRIGTLGDGGVAKPVLSIGGLELRVESSFADERAAMRNARWNLAMAGTLGLALAFVVSLVVSRNLVRPILEMKVAAQRIGSGDLTTQMATDRDDEIGEVVRAFEAMTRKLGGTIRRVAFAADRIEATAGAITQGTRRFESVTREQQRGNEEAAATLCDIEELIGQIAKSAGSSARSLDLAVDGSTTSFRELASSGHDLEAIASKLVFQVDEITRSLEQVAASSAATAGDSDSLLFGADAAAARVGEMANAARSVNENAEETSRLSGAVVKTAERGRLVVRRAVEGMDSTRSTIEEAERVIRSVSTRATEIGSILNVIDDVTEKTSLLALNAAIIAARGGAEGKAFAVVADEMKALSERVRSSTREISEVVKAVQGESANAVESIARGSTHAREGVDLIRQAETSLAEITDAARESGDRMEQSTVFTKQQMEAARAAVDEMEAVRAGAENIRAVTRDQAQASEAVQCSSDALREVAQLMRTTVDLQTGGAARIGQSMEDVQRAVREITQGLAQQDAASQQVADVVQRSMEYTRSHDASATEMADATGELGRQVDALREAVERFKIAEDDGPIGATDRNGDGRERLPNHPAPARNST